MERFLRYALACGLVFVMAVTMFGAGFAAGRLTAPNADLPQVNLPLINEPTPAAGQATPADLQETFAPFWEAWGLVHDEYVDQPVDDTLLMQGAIRGMLKALGDPHTGYMSRAEAEISNTDLAGEYEGIGAYVQEDGDYLRIVSPMDGSPAEAAGILAGDLVIKVDGEDMAGLGETEIIRRVRGPAGTSVHLSIQRQGHAELLEFDIVRQRFDLVSVESEMLEGNIAYIQVNTFGEKTTAELEKALETLLAEKPAGLILDLRNNPGGYLTTAIEVVSQFIPDGVVMRERFGDGREKTYDARRGGLATEIPLVVLINEGSASASEIVAGAVQDLERGTLVGMTSFGKGSVQSVHDLAGDGGQARITIARWYTPDGRSIHGDGITPDVEVEITDEDRQAERDPQLQKALELLR